jgi:sodium/myo-inositol cotransporter 3
MQAVPSTTYVNPSNNMTCGVPGTDSWQLLRAPFGSDMPWPGFLLGQTPASIWYWCADQIMVQKVLSAKSLSDAQGATIFCGWIKVLPLFLIVIPGMISRVLYPDEVGCVDPEICQAVCQNSVSCSNIAFPKLVLGIMPEGLRGIMISVMLAALMSDLTSIFNSASTLFTMDVYRRFRENAKARELLLVGRLSIVVLVAVSIGWIPLIQQMQGGQLYIYIQSIAAYLSPPIAMIFCMAIAWPRMNEKVTFERKKN